MADGDAVPGEVLEDSAEDLYEDAPCGYLSTGPRGEIVKVNATFLRWTGYRREDLVGRRRFQDLLTGGGRIFHETHFAPLLRMQGEVHEIALEVVCASGERLPVLVNSTVKQDEEGRPVVVRTTVFNAVERRRYERELLIARDAERAARERTARLQRLTAALAAPLDREHIADTVIDALVEATGAADVAVALVDDDGVLEVVGRGTAATARQAWRAALPSGEPVFVEDVDAEGGVRATALVPLVMQRRPVGVLWLGFGTPRAFPEEERALVGAIAAQAATAFERARLIEETERAARRAAYMADVTRELYEVAGVAERVARLVGLLVPVVAEQATVEPDDRVDVADVVRRARASGRPELDEPSRAVALPLRALGHTFGVLFLANGPAARQFRAADLPFLADVANRAALALENARLYEQQRDVAQVLQRSMLAGSAPLDDRFEVVAFYRPAVETLEVGGDWYDCFLVSQDRVGIVVGDVVGRGIEAASAMGQVRSAIRALAGAELGPGRLLERLDAFVEHLPGARFATTAYAEVALGSGAMVYACAGHLPPLLQAPGRDAELLWDGRSPPLGANFTGAARPEATLVLPLEARLLLYTDGLVERRRRSLDLGVERLAQAFARRRDVPLPALAHLLTDELLQDFSGGDDVCLLCFRYRGGSPVAAGAGDDAGAVVGTR
jgi:serine/threonine-protein kinase RsbW